MNVKIPKSREMGILAVLVVIALAIGLNSSAFFSLENLFDVIKSNIVLGIMAVAMLPIIITGGIDVSVASMVSAVTVIIGQFMMRVSPNIPLVFLVGCLAGAAMGLVNGLLIARLRIPPIVATLGTMSVIIGLVLYLTNGTWITGLPQNFIDFGRTTIFSIPAANDTSIGLPIQFVFLVLAILLMWFVLRYSLPGRGIYAMGGNMVSAERVGYSIPAITIFIYTFEGLLVGLAGTVHTSIMRQVDPNAFLGFEMQVVAAVVLGGASTLGGFGSVLGTMLGVALLSILNNGLILMRIPVFWQKIVVGLVLLVSVGFDTIRKRLAEAKMTRVDIEKA